MQLTEEDAKVLISLPPEVEPAHVRKLADLEARFEALQAESAADKAVIRSMVAGQKLRYKLALRKLLDDTRTYILDRPLREAERGPTWNQILESDDLDLKGLSREAANLTKFGRGTQQRESSEAAHDFTVIVIAEAVTSVQRKGDLFRKLFKTVYKQDADELLFNPSNPEVIV